jgi:lipopolysaccharide transport system ATP-binding protein
MTDVVLRVENLSKQYRIGQRTGYGMLRESIADRLRGRRARQRIRRESTDRDLIWALKDISFELERGGILGIIGSNGSGKSTLLKILSRITQPTSGRAEIRGRVGALLEVGTGFHLELTGRENIYLSGNILGMRKAEIARKFDEIVEFSGVERFIDTPVKRYSSGMAVRLGFAVAAHLEPEVLLVDEVLAVGDVAFQKRCLGKMEGMAGSGRTVLFVSHGMGAVKSMCTQAILLEGGRLRMHGPVAHVVDSYLAGSTRTPTTQATFPENEELEIQILRTELVSGCSGRNQETTELKCTYVVRRALQGDILLCVEVRNRADVSVFYSHDGFLPHRGKRTVGVHTVMLSIPTHLLAPGEYLVALGFWEPGHAPVHFPDVRLTFRREEPDTGLSARGIAWPSVIYMPAVWTYVQGEGHASEGGNG